MLGNMCHDMKNSIKLKNKIKKETKGLDKTHVKKTKINKLSRVA